MHEIFLWACNKCKLYLIKYILVHEYVNKNKIKKYNISSYYNNYGINYDNIINEKIQDLIWNVYIDYKINIDSLNCNYLISVFELGDCEVLNILIEFCEIKNIKPNIKINIRNPKLFGDIDDKKRIKYIKYLIKHNYRYIYNTVKRENEILHNLCIVKCQYCNLDGFIVNNNIISNIHNANKYTNKYLKIIECNYIISLEANII